MQAPHDPTEQRPGGVRRLLRASAGLAVPLVALAAAYLVGLNLLPPLVAALGLPRLLVPLLTAGLVLAVYVLVVRRFEHRSVAELDRRRAAPELLLGLLAGTVLCAVSVGVLALLGVYRVVGMNPLDMLWNALAAAIMAGVCEELFFRGVLFRKLQDWQGTWIALAVSAVVFGAAHLGNPTVTVLGAVAIAVEAGLLLGLAFVATGRLWLPIGIHIAWNTMSTGVFGNPDPVAPRQGLLRPEVTGPELLSGGSVGVEASVVTIAACLALAALLLRSARRTGRIVPRQRADAAR